LEATNVEFIEFWLLDPFIYNKSSSGGKLYLHLGNISEDILRDSRMQFENGLACDTNALDRTAWGRVPKLPPLVNAFDNDPNTRPCQDVGFDGLNDVEERNVHASFLQKLSAFLNPDALAVLQNDPASDNFRFFLDNSYRNERNILPRYKDFNSPQGNSPVQTAATGQTTAGTNLPDNEDLNRDFSLNENEEYFQYEIDISPQALEDEQNPYIVSRLRYPDKSFNGVPQPAWTWYQFRIPINNYKTRVGAIPDFKSIQFIRMLLSDFQDSITLRFGTLELVRNQWRTYPEPLNDPTDQIPTDNNSNTRFLVSAVGVEENSGKEPVNYVMPPNLIREQGIGAQTNQFIPLNESSLSTTVRNLKDGDLRAVFKNMGIDLRRYKKLRMFIHANEVPDSETGPVRDNEVVAFIRLGIDFKDNYYQYEIPLKITPNNSKYDPDNNNDRRIVWPDSNEMVIDLPALVDLKQQRNLTPGYPRDIPFSVVNNRGHLMTIVGNPDLGAIKTVMLGIKNPSQTDKNNPLKDKDDGLSKSVEVWFNEMRASEFDEFGGAAALGNVQLKLADLGLVNVSASMHTRGFGQLEQKIDQRFKDNFWQYDVNSTFQLGRFFPAQAGVQLPFYAGIAQSFSTPEFDPYQLDIPTEKYLRAIREVHGADSSRNYRSKIQTINTRRGWNFTNVRIVPQTKQKKPRIYDPGNWNFTYAFTEQVNSDPFLEKNSRKNYIAQVAWNYSPQPKDIFPFKKLIKSKSKWLDIIRDINFNLIPSALGVTSDWNREFGEIRLRPLGEDDYTIPPLYFKFFKWNRSYTFNYNPFKSLSLQFSAINNARVDEPDGLLDTKEKRDTFWRNFWQGGRNTNYTQNFNANYNLPINKIPLFDFINANVSYAATYNWMALPQVKNDEGKWIINPMGNTISNNQNNRGKIDFDFRRLYNKSPFLKVYNTPNPNLGDKKAIKTKKEATLKARQKIKEDIEKLKERRKKLKEELKTVQSDMQMDTAKKAREIKRLKTELKANKGALKQKKTELKNKQLPSDPYISLFLRPALMVKRMSVEVRQNAATTLPGFMGYSRLLGNDLSALSPGFDFVFGNQPGIRLFSPLDQYDANARDQWLNRAASQGWITRD
ncbi:MAG: cell surface protein SprA, partial [Chitinophagales bacterium]|nr:cell surface protein SprA [Chitinophagales bacterium]